MLGHSLHLRIFQKPNKPKTTKANDTAHNNGYKWENQCP
jgi:hypothetical protein